MADLAVSGDMSFFERADDLVSAGGLFDGTTDLSMLVLVHAFEQLSNLRLDDFGNTTSLTMRRDAESTFRDHYDLSAEQYGALEQICDHEGGLGNVYEAYIQSLPPTTPGVRPGFVRRTVGYGDSRCPNEGCADRVMRVRSLDATFYGIDECYPVKHYAKVCQGGCGSTYYLNKKKRRGHDGSTWHTFYAWEDGIPDEITNKSGKSVMSAAFLTQVALTMSRMRYVYTGYRLPVCVDLFVTYTVLLNSSTAGTPTPVETASKLYSALGQLHSIYA